MIEIADKKQCCGCGACMQICPQNCIELVEDDEGFSYPEVNISRCIACGKCERVCPVPKKKYDRKLFWVGAAKIKNDQIRLQSSSGGVFTALAERTLKRGGIVFGAALDECLEVFHRSVTNPEDLALLRNSKYVQSRIGTTYQEAETWLLRGREVLYTGTPCQIAGLKSFLRKDYNLLLTVEVFCHGVPSPKVWRMNLNEQKTKLSARQHQPVDIVSVNFRDKVTGWKHYSCSMITKPVGVKGAGRLKTYTVPTYASVFLQGFLHDLYLRPICYSCCFRRGKSDCDLAIGDYWAATRSIPDFNDDQGLNDVAIYSSNGMFAFEALDLDKKMTSLEDIQKENGAFSEKVAIPQKRDYFFSQLTNDKNISQLILKCIRPNLLIRIRQKIERTIKQILK